MDELGAWCPDVLQFSDQLNQVYFFVRVFLLLLLLLLLLRLH